MKAILKMALAAAGVAIATQAAAQVTFYEREGFDGRAFTTNQRIDNLQRNGFNDRASSVVVAGERWEVCEDAGFGGRCVVLRPGRYPSLAAMGLNDRISSVRDVSRNARIEDYRYAPSPVAAPRITFYERDNFGGRYFATEQAIANLERNGYNDRASSVIVDGDRWQVCEDVRFGGRCAELPPGRYPSLAAMGLNDRISSVRDVSRNAPIADNRNAPAPVAAPRITFYEGDNFSGRYFATEQQIANLQRNGFNDRASSVIVDGDRWQVCEDVRFGGRCAELPPGRYPSLAAMGLNDRVSSVRSLGVNAPAPAAAGDYRRRPNERLYQAQVTSVRAVVGTPEQRCWVEQEQVPQERGKLNLPGAAVGAIIGGILGHQIGSGRGQDIATVGGAVAGGAVGANVGRDRSGQQVQTRDVQRCENVPSQARPDYWDVTYNFRGQDYRMQMTEAPGPTVMVNEQGEPRAVAP